LGFVRAEDVSGILGLTPAPVSWAELDAMVVSGLPKSSLDVVLDRVCADRILRKEVFQRIISKSTYKKRKINLSTAESERLERLARTFACTLYIWKNDEDSRAFLCNPHPLLSGMTPLKTSESELGARRVEVLLHDLFYGLPI